MKCKSYLGDRRAVAYSLIGRSLTVAHDGKRPFLWTAGPIDGLEVDDVWMAAHQLLRRT